MVILLMSGPRGRQDNIVLQWAKDKRIEKRCRHLYSGHLLISEFFLSSNVVRFSRGFRCILKTD